MTGIILVGPNSSGKTTLAAALSKSLQMERFHSGNAPIDDEAIMTCVITQGKMLRNNRIVDRVTAICHPIYNTPLSKCIVDRLYGAALALAARYPIIYCVAEGSPVDKDKYPEGHYEMIVRDKEYIVDRYELLMDSLAHIRYDWTKDSYEELLKELR